MKYHVVGAKLFHVDRGTDGLTDMTKLRVPFHNSTFCLFFFARTLFIILKVIPILSVKATAVLSSRGLYIMV